MEKSKNNDDEYSKNNENSSISQSEKLLITQSTEVNTESQKKKKGKKHKKKKTPKKIKKEELTEEQISKFRLQDKTIADTFINYYKHILNFDEKEFSEFLKISVEELPIIFRLNKIYTYSESLEEEISECLLRNKEHFNNRISRPRLNFLDNIYQIDKLDKSNNIDATLKQILFTENDYGILRQELVSMIPVNLIDIEESDIILDMCAAPGNKTIQILEIMSEKARNKNTLPSGVIIANELDDKRAGNMAHFFKAHFPINIVVTNNNAETLPIFEDENYRPNIVICDVPCSGDGTLRKNKMVRKKWKIEFGLENHFTQIKILDNAIRQCKNDGYIIYSTCAINPIENEAVVCAIMEKYNDEIELINCSKKLRDMNIKFREGLIKWKVCVDMDKDKNYIWKEKYSDVKNNRSGLIKETMFHNIYTYKNNHPSALFKFTDPLNLRNCIRIYSHENNSDCFFIAVIHKKNNFNSNTHNKNSHYSVPLNENKMKTIGEDLEDFMDFLGIENDEKMPDNNNIDNNDDKNEIKLEENNISDEKQKSSEEDLIFKKYVKISSYPESYNDLMKYFKFKNGLLVRHLFCKRESSQKIFLFSKKLSEMITIFTKMNLNIIRSGLVVFKKEREKSIKMMYRVTHYGAILMADYFGGQIIELDRPNLIKMMFDSDDLSIPFDKIPEEEKKKIDECESGCIVLLYDAFILVSRKGKGTLHLMLPKFPKGTLKKYFLRAISDD